MEETMNDERRTYNRFEIPLEVTFNVSKGDADHTGFTKNFSRSGLCLESSDAAPVSGDVIDLNIKHPNDDTYVSAVGDVVWQRKDDEKCLMGIRLLVMDREAKTDILNHAYDNWLAAMRS